MGTNHVRILVLIVMSDDAVEEGKILINKGKPNPNTVQIL